MARYSWTYTQEVSHKGLNKYRLIKGTDEYEVNQKAIALVAQWNDEWSRRVAAENKREAHISNKDLAARKTANALKKLEEIKNVISDGCASSIEFKWKKLEQNKPFGRKEPMMPNLEALPSVPIKVYTDHMPKFGFLELISPARKASAVALADAKNAELRKDFEDSLKLWRENVKKIEIKNSQLIQKYESALHDWREERKKHFESQDNYNKKLKESVILFQNMCKCGDENSIRDLISRSINTVKIPEFVDVNFNIDYSGEIGSCVIDYIFPPIVSIPTLNEVRYIQSNNDFVYKHISNTERDRLYDYLLYQLTILNIHTAFRSEGGGFLKRVTFNGWVDHVVSSTGIDERTCILSVGVNREDLDNIDITRVDARQCFKSLKGVAASKLVGLAPVAPLERPRHADKRFVESLEVASTLDEGVNLAAMDWQEFEHLVRQIFEHEYSSPGSEVRVTQASRDGGVDAIVHDPDPIKGGKIVIQAKRYTNTVDVAAVRDLYGTVHNEGAIKGILITTSQFGPDARKFAQGKPITLLDGSNLLFLLEKMGTKARIDLRDAKKILGEREQANLRR